MDDDISKKPIPADTILFECVSKKDSRSLLSWWNANSHDTFRREFLHKRYNKKFYKIIRSKKEGSNDT